jgi:hypothetical protein
VAVGTDQFQRRRKFPACPAIQPDDPATARAIKTRYWLWLPAMEQAEPRSPLLAFNLSSGRRRIGGYQGRECLPVVLQKLFLDSEWRMPSRQDLVGQFLARALNSSAPNVQQRLFWRPPARSAEAVIALRSVPDHFEPRLL